MKTRSLGLWAREIRKPSLCGPSHFPEPKGSPHPASLHLPEKSQPLNKLSPICASQPCLFPLHPKSHMLFPLCRKIQPYPSHLTYCPSSHNRESFLPSATTLTPATFGERGDRIPSSQIFVIGTPWAKLLAGQLSTLRLY